MKLDLSLMPRKHWRAVLYNDPCAYCGAECQEIDHISSTVGSGKNDHTNLTAACRHCNRSKKSQTLLGFLARLPIGHNAEYRVRGIHYDKAYRDTPAYQAEHNGRYGIAA